MSDHHDHDHDHDDNDHGKDHHHNTHHNQDQSPKMIPAGVILTRRSLVGAHSHCIVSPAQNHHDCDDGADDDDGDHDDDEDDDDDDNQPAGNVGPSVPINYKSLNRSVESGDHTRLSVDSIEVPEKV